MVSQFGTSKSKRKINQMLSNIINWWINYFTLLGILSTITARLRYLIIFTIWEYCKLMLNVCKCLQKAKENCNSFGLKLIFYFCSSFLLSIYQLLIYKLDKLDKLAIFLNLIIARIIIYT
jgi:hypothetical protein